MNPEQPQVALTSRYSIKDTCRLLGIHRDTLYKYTHTTNEIKCGWRESGGRKKKFYLGSEILRFWNKQI
ncbi:MAG: helix-turn-helix domain-containing protein [Paramuribaculum sp.]|nr:helix-turn-helix domain-containing protein [Paramuribaculum sp.]